MKFILMTLIAAGASLYAFGLAGMLAVVLYGIISNWVGFELGFYSGIEAARVKFLGIFTGENAIHDEEK